MTEVDFSSLCLQESNSIFTKRSFFISPKPIGGRCVPVESVLSISGPRPGKPSTYILSQKIQTKISSLIKFSNRSDPKRQLEASNQFYSLLWSKKASLQTVIDNLLAHGINNQNEDISSGMVFIFNSLLAL